MRDAPVDQPPRATRRARGPTCRVRAIAIAIATGLGVLIAISTPGAAWAQARVESARAENTPALHPSLVAQAAPDPPPTPPSPPTPLSPPARVAATRASASKGHAAEAAGAATAEAPPRVPPQARATKQAEDAAEASRDPAPKPPGGRFASRGVYSRFSFGLGVHIGVKSFTSGTQMLGGISGHFLASGIAGVTLELDFNRAQQEPTAEQLLESARYLHFIPNLRVHGVIFPYRWRMLGPFVLLGMGFDTEAHERSTNLEIGVGLEVSFWKHRLAVALEARAFFPLPSDVERHRERVAISGRQVDTSTSEYYNFSNLLFTASLRYYY